MIFPPGAVIGIQGEAAFGHSAHRNLVAHLKGMKRGRQFSPGDQFKEELQFGFIGRRDDRVGPLDMFSWRDDAKSGVLAGREVEFRAGIKTNGPKIVRDVTPLDDSRAIELFFVIYDSRDPSC